MRGACRRQVHARRDQRDRVAHGDAQRLRQVDAENHAVAAARRAVGQGVQAAHDDGAADLGDLRFERRVDDLHAHGLAVRSRRLEQAQPADRRRGAHDARRLHAGELLPEIAVAAGLVDVDVRGRPHDPIAHLPLDARHQRERDDHRGHADADAENRHRRDDRDERLASSRGQVAAGDEPGQGHGRIDLWGDSSTDPFRHCESGA
jgi:hypothetical protein